MQDCVVESKVSVFISSKCGGRYTIVRKALKERLEDTNMAKVYVFEHAPGSSSSLSDSYLSRIDESDLCVILIDNKDGITDPVLSEQKRAKSLNKKLIYIFCDENEKTPTEMQRELQTGNNEKYSTVHEFSDITHEAFRSIMQDIVYTYKDREGIHSRENAESSSEEMPLLSSRRLFTINKNVLEGFDLTKTEIIKLIDSDYSKTDNTSLIDSLSKDFLKFVLRIDSYRPKVLRDLAAIVEDLYDDDIKSFINKRFIAMDKYYSGCFEAAITEIENAIMDANNNEKIPNWLLNDAAIDMRNIQFLLNETINTFSLNPKGQIILNENNEPLYYPLIDRADSNLKGALLKKYFSYISDSPYTTQLGGFEDSLNNASYCFIVALLHGSIMQTEFIRDRLKNIFITLCTTHDDHELYVELLNYLVIERSDKQLEKILRKYNLSFDIVNSNDINYILSRIDNIPFEHHKIISTCILVKNFGNYFSDGQFEESIATLSKHMDSWFIDEHRVHNYINYYVKMIKNNIHRLDINYVCIYCNKLMEEEFARWRSDSLSIVKVINFDDVKIDVQKSTIKCLLHLIENVKEINQYQNLSAAIIQFRKTATIDCSELDSVIKSKWATYYDNIFYLEVFLENWDKSFEYINKFLSIIHNRNETQGLNGVIQGFADNPYLTIKNIISYNSIILDEEQLEAIIEVIKETLVAPLQTVKDKISACRLLLFIINSHQSYSKMDSLLDFLVESKSEILVINRLYFFEKDTFRLLEFNYYLLLSIWKTLSSLEIIKIFVGTEIYNDYETIDLLRSLDNFLEQMDYSKIDSFLTTTIFQYVAGKCFYKERDIRILSAQVLIRLTHSPIQDLALQQLSLVMDKGTSEIKLSVLRRAKIIHETNQILTSYIIQKGRVDTNYLVRQAAIRISKSVDET